MFIKIVESEYLTGDKDVDTYLECFKEVYIFGKIVYSKVVNSTNIEKISKFSQTKRKPVGFNTNIDEHDN